MSAPDTTPRTGWHMDQRLALHNVQAPRSARVLARLLVVLLAVTAAALVLTPWQQNIPGAGRVIAFSPEERLQQIEAAALRMADLCKQMLAYSGKGRFVIERLTPIRGIARIHTSLVLTELKSTTALPLSNNEGHGS